jgi:hypothetical protein
MYFTDIPLSNQFTETRMYVKPMHVFPCACVRACFFIRFGSIIVSVQHDVITGPVRRSLSSAVA